MRLKDIIRVLEDFAPPKLAYSWDNTGLLIGDEESDISKVLLALDVTPSVVKQAIEKGFDLIITHHPLFITPMKRINDPLILKMIRHGISLYTMHTNLDLVKDGVSKALAEKFKLRNTDFISKETATYHIALYTPPEAVEKVASALHEAGAGIIGNYSHCLNSYRVSGQFRPLEGSNPALGSRDELESLEEIKLEFFVDEPLLESIKGVIHSVHPYETPAYAIYPLQQQSLNYGLGVIGDLPAPVKIGELAQIAKERLQAPFVRLWLADKTADTEVKRVAICGGSGSSLIESIAGKADIFISADFTYHKIMDSPLPLIDAGHFYTEYPVLTRLQALLKPLNLTTEVIDIWKLEVGNLLTV